MLRAKERFAEGVMDQTATKVSWVQLREAFLHKQGSLLSVRTNHGREGGTVAPVTAVIW